MGFPFRLRRSFRPVGRPMYISAETHRSHLSVRFGWRRTGCVNQRSSPTGIQLGPLRLRKPTKMRRVSEKTSPQAFLPVRHTKKYANFLSISQYLLIGIFRALAVQYDQKEQAPPVGALHRRSRPRGNGRANTPPRLSFTNPSPLHIATARHFGAAPLLLSEKAAFGWGECGRNMKLIFFYRYILTY